TPNIIPEPTIAAATPSACDKPVEDVDYEGNDIKFTQRSNSDDCCDDCTKTPGCVAYVWTAWNDGTCFLKSNADKSVPKKGAKAAKVANDCTKTPGCVAYVWTAWNDGTCFLKSNADKSVPKKGAKAAKVVF
ncbi:hypothetical protein DYB38_013433, partial [Aphanomyces astaci]